MEEFFLHSSYFGIMLVLILTGCGLPIPEEVPIIAAGVMSSPPDAILNSPWLAWGACMIGAVLGDSAMYWIGHHFGRSGLREHPVLVRHLTPERERKIEQMIARHGLKVFFLARFMLGVRAPVYITCGILRVRFRWFLLADAISASVVVSVVFGLSYWFGESIRRWIRYTEWGVTIAVVVALVVVATVAYCKYRKKDDPPSNEQQTPAENKKTVA